MGIRCYFKKLLTLSSCKKVFVVDDVLLKIGVCTRIKHESILTQASTVIIDFFVLYYSNVHKINMATLSTRHMGSMWFDWSWKCSLRIELNNLSCSNFRFIKENTCPRNIIFIERSQIRSQTFLIPAISP